MFFVSQEWIIRVEQCGLLKFWCATCGTLQRVLSALRINREHPVLVPVPMAQEYDDLTTLLRVCYTDTKITNKQKGFL